MTPLKFYKETRRKAFRKYRELHAAWQAALKEHTDWLHAYPERWEARCLNTFAADELAKHKELEAKVAAASLASGLAAVEWKLLNDTVAELEAAK